MGVSLVTSHPAKASAPRVTYSFNDTVSLALEKQISNLVKMARYTAFYAGQSMGKTPDSLQNFMAQMGNFKNILSIRSFHKEIPGAGRALSTALTQRSASAAQSALLGCGKCFNALADTVEVVSVFVPLNPALTACVKKTNVWVTGTCAALSALKEVKAFLKADLACEPEQQILSLLRLALSVSYVAFAAICIVSSSMGVVPSAVAVVTCLTSGTLFGLGSFFYEMLNDPYRENYNNLVGRAKLA